MASIQEGLYDLGRLDRLSYLDTPIHRIDPRAKVVTTAVFLVCVVSFPKYALLPMLPFLFFPLLTSAQGSLPLGFLVRKLLAVAPFAVLVGVFNPVLDREVIVQLGSLGVAGGWVSFASIMLRFFLTTLAALVLIATTSFAGVCMALQRLGLPDVLVTQLLLLYRYIFVLGDQVMRMARARSLKSFGTRGMSMRVYASMLGHLLLRTYARAQRIYQAMVARGFDGQVRTTAVLRIKPLDVSYTLGWSAVFVAFRFVNVPLVLGEAVMRVSS